MDARQRAEKLNQINHSTVGTGLLEILREEKLSFADGIQETLVKFIFMMKIYKII